MECPKCGNELKWISQYSRYYCKVCKDYPKIRELAEQQSREDVQKELKDIRAEISNYWQADIQSDLKSVKHGVWILVYIAVAVVVVTVVLMAILLTLILGTFP